jgi:predicted TIM-barrel fold metal-dependent hydrolase
MAGLTAPAERAEPGVRRTLRGVIDCDVHHEWATPAELLSYLSEGWREYVSGLPDLRTGERNLRPFTPAQGWANPVFGYRPEAYPPGGGAPASDPDVLRDQLLDAFDCARVLLHFESGGYLGALTNPFLATEIARACNDWTIDRWLGRDDPRLHGAMVVATQDPVAAAAEFRRVGGHARIAEVLLSSTGLGKPFGHPAYHPIYEAAVEMGLPIAIHAFGDVHPGQNVSPTASGVPSFYLETQALAPQGLQTHVTSMIACGLFERFPTLRLLLVESGVAWVPGWLWRLDACFKAVRREVPWLRRLPSEYVRDHVRLTTQPLDEAPTDAALVDLLSSFGAEDLMLYSSDYPHWDMEAPDLVARRLPQAWWPKVFHDNAIDFFGWDDLRGQGGAAGAP